MYQRQTVEFLFGRDKGKRVGSAKRAAKMKSKGKARKVLSAGRNIKPKVLSVEVYKVEVYKVEE